VLTYKTVRTRPRGCYPIPNLLPVAVDAMDGSSISLVSTTRMQGSWAVSFGMPSKPPEHWRADIEATRCLLGKDKILSVSVVASPEDHWTIDDVADDFARCAGWAVESGADCIEANFSCPNVASVDGQLYHQPEAAARVAERLREAVGSKPLLIKIGQVPDETAAENLSQALAPHATALVMINCLAAKVVDPDRCPLFNGEKRGIAGEAIRETVLDQVQCFARVIERQALKLRLVGVGGIGTAQHVRAHLNAGSHAIQLATAAMLDPGVGCRIRRVLASSE